MKKEFAREGTNGMGGWRLHVNCDAKHCTLHINNQTFMMVLTNIEIVRSIFPTVTFLCSGSPVYEVKYTVINS